MILYLSKELAISKANDISARILRQVGSEDYRPQRVRKLAASMGVDEHEYEAFRAALRALMKAGLVVRGGGNCVMPADTANVIIGSFRGNPRGFGFVVPDLVTDYGDLFIPPGSTLDAMTGDTVAARITRRSKRGDPSLVEGRVVEILERGQSRFVGELRHEGSQWMLLPDGHTLHAPVLLGDARSSRAKTGDQIVVELTEFPSGDRPARGVIVEVLGRRGDPGVDTASIIRQYHFHEKFSKKILTDTRWVIRGYHLEKELDRRDDLRAEVVVTIDPDEAKDFDDAISIRQMSGGIIELGVHIADVSTFVQPDSSLDQEAKIRGNSVYLPRYVIPMLPEVLSNGLCSLQEGEPRLTKSVFIEYDRKGQRKAKRFANTVIQSRKRLTYRQVTRILEGHTRGFEPEVVELVGQMEHLARIIQERRLAKEMIVLELPEIELVLDDNDELIDVVPTDTSFSHTIIEMFMVESNEAVAELFTSLKVPHLRRIHPELPANPKRKLTNFIRILGRAVPTRLERSDIIRLLDSVRGEPESFPVNLAVLRSMAPAEYSPMMIGHFALASRDYSHFTSPIRRYPDLTVHRLLEMYLTGRLKTRRDRAAAPSTEMLVEIGTHCSYTERHAEAAERELKLVKILRFLAERVGDRAEGVVTEVTKAGVFVQLDKYLVDGLVQFADLPDDWWDINACAGCVVGRRSRKRIAIGDRVLVQIAGVNLAARELDLVIAEKQKEGQRRSSTKAPARKTGKKPPLRKRRYRQRR